MVRKKALNRLHIPKVASLIRLNSLHAITITPHLRLFVLIQSKVQPENQGKDTYDEHDDKKRPPLEPPPASSRFDALFELSVRLFVEILDMYCLVLDLCQRHFLIYYRLIQLGE